MLRSLLLLAILLFAQSGPFWQDTSGPNQQAADSDGFEVGLFLDDPEKLGDDSDFPKKFTGAFSARLSEFGRAHFPALTPRRNIPLTGSIQITGNGIRAPPSTL